MRKGRPREFDEEAVIGQVMEVFWRRGYAATSIQDLVEATGVQRGSLYAAFGSKEALLLRALARYGQLVSPAFAGLAAGGPILPALREYLSNPLEQAKARESRGCLLGNTSIEMDPGDTEVAQAIQSGFTSLESTISLALENAYDRGELPRREASVQARMLVTVEQGLEIVARTAADVDGLYPVVEAALENLRR